MATKQEQYRFRNGVTPLDEREFNGRFFDVDARLHGLEQTRIAWDAAVATLNETGLARLALLLEQLGAQAATARAADQATFVADEAGRDATLAAAVSAATASLAAAEDAFEGLAAALNNIIANNEGAGGALVALQLWRDTLDPDHDGQLFPDRLRSGPATITYGTGGVISALTTTLPGGAVFAQAYSYTVDGALSQIVATLGAVTLWTRTYIYDGSGALTGWTEA